MPKCNELLPCDWLISNLCYQVIEQAYLIKWPVSVYNIYNHIWMLFYQSRSCPSKNIYDWSKKKLITNLFHFYHKPFLFFLFPYTYNENSRKYDSDIIYDGTGLLYRLCVCTVHKWKMFPERSWIECSTETLWGCQKDGLLPPNNSPEQLSSNVLFLPWLLFWPKSLCSVSSVCRIVVLHSHGCCYIHITVPWSCQENIEIHELL